MVTKITAVYFEFYFIPDLCSKKAAEIPFSLLTHDSEFTLVSILGQLHSDHLNTDHFKL